MSRIPKKALKSSYYKAIYEDSLTRLDENHMKYLSSLYKRCWKLSLQNKHIEAESLLREGRQIVRRKESERIEEERERLEDDLHASEEEERERLEESRKRAVNERRKVMRRLYLQTNGVAPKRTRDNKKYNLRSNRVQRRAVDYFPDNLNEYILLYIEQIKHKKESLISFLTKMYSAGYIYRERTKKWGKVKMSQ